MILNAGQSRSAGRPCGPIGSSDAGGTSSRLAGMSYTRYVLSSAPQVRRQTPSGDHRAPFRWLSCGIESCADVDAPALPALTANSVVRVSDEVGVDARDERSSAYSRMDRSSSSAMAPVVVGLPSRSIEIN